MQKTRVLVIGHGAREHAIVVAFLKSGAIVFSYMEVNNPFSKLCEKAMIGKYSDFEAVLSFAKENIVDFVFIGPEGPLAEGIVDFLEGQGISCIWPSKSAALIETSKIFAREFMKEFKISGCPEFWVVRDEQQLQNVFFYHHEKPFVIKPDGLTGGKGVKVEGDHFNGHEEGMRIAREYIQKDKQVLIEEKLEGEEFVILYFCDGKTIKPMLVVRDYKRRLVDDKGLNTGSMGSYSCANHLLPYLSNKDIEEANAITQRMIDSLQSMGLSYIYKGILYGSFITTKDGVKVIEWNVRFGDPEAINVLVLLETHLDIICQAIIDGTLDKMTAYFKEMATVVKYVVPNNYALEKDDPNYLESGYDIIQIHDIGDAQIFYSSIFEDDKGWHMTSSRCLAVLGVAKTVEEAEQIAEKGAKNVTGFVDYRLDIGTAELIEKGVAHMCNIKG